MAILNEVLFLVLLHPRRTLPSVIFSNIINDSSQMLTRQLSLHFICPRNILTRTRRKSPDSFAATTMIETALPSPSECPEDEHKGDGAAVQAPKKIWSRQPDLQIGERNTQFPGCVVEVACSQSSADLEPLAYDYFSNTSFGVQLFIFVDIKENARISVLRGNAGVLTWGMQQVEFQTADKHPANINLALELNVKDFVLSTEVGQYPDLAIRIPFQELHEMLRQARRDSLVKKGRGGNIRRPNKFDGEMVLPANFRTTKYPVAKGDGQFNGNQTTDEVTERQGAYGFRPGSDDGTSL
ncbi:hypothetical protein FOIG_10357 [Fusarium odoratissimum NRRL 54006]|uniref:Uncharacterized protein n=2 Tax=Fusarium oxysporum species complex TaxID=171631 RepID=X0J7Z2_FUSO5|nr:uncharacterized protein FOIG_10357 [Fusarium odoratissimum NRRL 54006]EXL97308.1 hypothetical protein FOIG_10357 [Fusarium odoratissimum NRRL 54006]